MTIPLGALPNRFTIRARAISGTDIYGNELREDVTELTGIPGRADLAFVGEDLGDRTEERERFDVILAAGAVIVDGWDGLVWEDYPTGAIDLELDGPSVPVFDAVATHHLELTAYRTRG